MVDVLRAGEVVGGSPDRGVGLPRLFRSRRPADGWREDDPRGDAEGHLPRLDEKRVGNNPRVKLLLLHGGPGATHELYEAFDSYLPAAGIEYYYYDQLGSYYSDQPSDPNLWDTSRFVEEVEQVRLALGLNAGNFFLLGQSWGGLLAIEYALKYQTHLKALVISNMMASIPAYNRYAREVLMPAIDQDALAEIQRLEAAAEFEKPRVIGAPDGAPLRPSRPPHAARPLAGTRAAHVQAPQPVGVRPDAGAQRTRSRGQDPRRWNGTADLWRIDPADAHHRRGSRHPWNPRTWSGWPGRFAGGGISTARTEVTWPSSTTRRPTCRA